MKIDLSRNTLSYQVIRMWECNVCGHLNGEELTTCEICGAFIEESYSEDIDDEFLDEEEGLL
jgi:rubrerythrin